MFWDHMSSGVTRVGVPYLFPVPLFRLANGLDEVDFVIAGPSAFDNSVKVSLSLRRDADVEVQVGVPVDQVRPAHAAVDDAGDNVCCGDVALLEIRPEICHPALQPHRGFPRSRDSVSL